MLNFVFFALFSALECLLPYLELPLHQLTRRPSAAPRLVWQRLRLLRLGFEGLYCLPSPQDVADLGTQIDDDFIKRRAWLPRVQPVGELRDCSMLAYHQARQIKRQRSFDHGSDLSGPLTGVNLGEQPVYS